MALSFSYFSYLLIPPGGSLLLSASFNTLAVKLYLTLLLSVCSAIAFAQTGTIRGTILEDETGMTVIGANVLVEQLGTGTTTDLDGQFSLNLDPGTYSLKITYIGFQAVNIQDLEVSGGGVSVLEDIRLKEENLQLSEVVVTAKAMRNTETALLTIKRKAPAMMDGISSSRMALIGDATAVEAAKRVTGVSIEGGKYVYIRGLGDRYAKTTLNGIEIPGLDPDRNTLQMDIFPTNLIDNIIISKNFTADMPADFSGGLLNVETKAFPEEKIVKASVSMSINPSMHFQPDYLTYNGGATDFLGFDDGTRAIPDIARQSVVPTPVSGASNQQVTDFVRSFNPELGTSRQTSFADYSAGVSLGNQIDLGNGDGSGSSPKLGYIFSLAYKSSQTFYDDVEYGEWQRSPDPSQNDLIYAVVQDGELGERNVLIGALGGLAYKTQRTKIRLTAMHLQNGESRAGKFFIDDNGEAIGKSGYFASSDNLEYNQRALSNLMINGTTINEAGNWEVDWKAGATLSVVEDPDLRKTAFSLERLDTLFSSGAGGNPTRIWRSLDEVNATAKIDLTRKYQFNGENANLKFGLSHTYKDRNYEILFFDMQFFGTQDWPVIDPNVVLDPVNIFPNSPNSLYYQSGNNDPNPNAYSSNVHNTGMYVSNEFMPAPELKAIVGVRAENYIQRHTGRDQAWASGNEIDGRNLDNEKVLESLDFFPSVNLIFAVNESQNIRAAFSRTIARPSFKELSFAQILDPVTNRIFNGSLFPYSDWSGELIETRITNLDLRWEYFMEGGQIFSVSGFFKSFQDPIELVRIPEQQTSTEFQPRNVGNGRLYGFEFEFRRNLSFLSPALEKFSVGGNVTLVQSFIDMSEGEFESRQNYERDGETVESEREMAGQAPYVINASLTYSNPEAGWDAGIFYNVKGQTLEIVGIGLYSDIFYQPFHNLSLSVNKRLGSNGQTSLDFKVSNLLNDVRESLYQSFEADPQVFTRFSPGMSISVGLSHRF